MKNLANAWAVLLILFPLFSTFAQNGTWSSSGTNIYNANSGNVGIGTQVPWAKLEVVGNTEVIAPSDNPGGGGIYLGQSPGNAQNVLRQTAQGNNFSIDQFNPNSGWISRMLIRNTDGNIGIGTHAPSSKLTVNGRIQSTTGGIQFPDGTIQMTASSSGGGSTGIYNIQNGYIYSHLPNQYSIIKVTAGGTGPSAWVGGLQAGEPGQMVQIYCEDNGINSVGAIIWNEYNNAPNENKIKLNNGLTTISITNGQSITLYYDNNISRWVVYEYYDDQIFTVGTGTIGNIPFLNQGSHRESNLYYNPNYNQILVAYPEPYNVSQPNYRLNVNGPVNASAYYVNGVPIGGGGVEEHGFIFRNQVTWGAGGPEFTHESYPNAFAFKMNDNGNVDVHALTEQGGKISLYASDKIVALGSDDQSTTYALGTLVIDNTVSPPDYVFSDGYTLNTLEELKDYVLLHKHLPGVKSEKEFLETGFDVVKDSYSFLEKIEELTLYTIEQEGKINDLQKQVQELKALIQSR